MNRQEVYDRVKAHLLAQSARAMNDRETCLYRDPNGLKCAIGCLIEDKFYSPALESHMVGEDMVQKALAKSGIEIEDEDDELFLTQLQKIHDMAPVPNWAHQLANHARKYGLNP